MAFPKLKLMITLVFIQALMITSHASIEAASSNSDILFSEDTYIGAEFYN
jgi:hypothetical protein